MGEKALGIGYQFNDQHRVELTMGTYSMESEEFQQFNLGYTYSPFTFDWRMGETKIFSPGVYAIYTQGDDYFTQSPDRYPYAEYYDPNGVRFGLSVAFSHIVRWSNYSLEMVYQVIALDQGIIAAYNNSNDLEELEYFTSSGLMLRFGF